MQLGFMWRISVLCRIGIRVHVGSCGGLEYREGSGLVSMWGIRALCGSGLGFYGTGISHGLHALDIG